MSKKENKLYNKFANLKLQSSTLARKLNFSTLKKSFSATEHSSSSEFFQITDLVRSSSVVATVISRKNSAKRVSFADKIGKQLTEVREYDEANELRVLYANHATMLPEEIPVVLSDIPTIKYFSLFPQPSRNYPSFMNQLWKQKVCLETAHVKNESVTGVIKVINLAFHKKVEVKITFDAWKSHTLRPAQYHSTESVSIDSFTFQFYIPPKTKNIKFCIRYECDGNEFWDNNEGVDYCISAAFVQTESQ